MQPICGWHILVIELSYSPNNILQVLPLSRWSSTLAGTMLLPFTRMASEPERDWITCGPGAFQTEMAAASHMAPRLKKETMDWMIGRIRWLNKTPNLLFLLMILRHIRVKSSGREVQKLDGSPCETSLAQIVLVFFKNRAEERTQMLQQLSHVRDGQWKVASWIKFC